MLRSFVKEHKSVGTASLLDFFEEKAGALFRLGSSTPYRRILGNVGSSMGLPSYLLPSVDGASVMKLVDMEQSPYSLIQKIQGDDNFSGSLTVLKPESKD